ncbi:MAG: betaine/proline/choline family ABC transporter ATP-binding protein [Solirubrobacteraceae bacterium]|nr:betaine/proline/choline family ABC transporter ATP-binding protein [Solirubrobacteraceae bacterium]
MTADARPPGPNANLNLATPATDAAGRTGHPAARLELKELTKHYPGAEHPAVDRLSLEVPAGEICVFVGPSGCGKTTAMRMINRMIDRDSGEILLDGRDVHDRDPSELRRDIGYVIQQIGLFPHRTIAENIGTVPALLGWSKTRIAERTAELLDLVGLGEEFAGRYPAQLSGGQRQRVGVARALAADPPLLLMDEPFGAIDPITRDRLQNEFLRLQKTLGRTIVFVTHDIDEAIKMGDRIAVLRTGGVLAQYATPEELLISPADDFVERFVGADRALKRLALGRVRDLELLPVTKVHDDDPSDWVRTQLAGAEVPYPLVVDAEDRPVAWLDDADLTGDRIRGAAGSEVAIIDEDTILRDAFSAVLQHRVRYAVVVDSRGHTLGVLAASQISNVLLPDGEEALPEREAAP